MLCFSSSLCPIIDRVASSPRCPLLNREVYLNRVQSVSLSLCIPIMTDWITRISIISQTVICRTTLSCCFWRLEIPTEIRAACSVLTHLNGTCNYKSQIWVSPPVVGGGSTRNQHHRWCLMSEWADDVWCRSVRLTRHLKLRTKNEWK